MQCHQILSLHPLSEPGLRPGLPNPPRLSESRLCFLRTLPLNSTFTSDGGRTWELLQKGAGAACGMMTRKGWWEVREDGKHGAQSLETCTEVWGLGTAHFMHPRVALERALMDKDTVGTLDPPGCGRCLFPSHLWLLFHHPELEIQGAGKTGNSGGQIYLPLFFFFFFGRWRESDTHSCMLQTQNLPVCYWGLGRMLQRPPPTGSGVLLPAPT